MPDLRGVDDDGLPWPVIGIAALVIVFLAFMVFWVSGHGTWTDLEPFEVD